MKAKIVKIQALEVLDSRGWPTLQVSVTTEEGTKGVALVPSGASKGEHEALELRDGEKGRYLGRGVQKALSHVKGKLAELFHGENVFDQARLDKMLIEADGSENKSRLGANALLGLSMAFAKAAAASLKMPLYRYLGGPFATLLPCPMMNILNGGVHADNGLEYQEFMIRPKAAATFVEALRQGVEVFHTLKGLLKKEGLNTAVGDEGGFAPKLRSNEEALEWIIKAIQEAGYRPGEEISIALDCAASEFYRDNKYSGCTSEEQVSLLEALVKRYPIDSIEDGMAQNDWEGWRLLTQRLGAHVQLVGDDLFVTNTKFLREGFKRKVANSILIKPNQIGTLTETFDCIDLAQKHGYTTILSHRSGESEDTTIADLAVAAKSGQIKTGSLCRSERTAKYNRLLTIESELGGEARFRDSNRCRCLGR